MGNKIGKYIVAGFSFAVAGFLIWYFHTLVLYILVAAVISLMGNPVVRLLDRVKIGKFKFPRALIAALTLILLWVLVVSFVSIFVPLVAYEASELSHIDVEKVQTNLEEPLNTVEGWMGALSKSDEKFDMKEYISEKFVSIVNVSKISNIFRALTELLGDIVIGFFAISFITFFFLKDDKLFKKSLLYLVPAGYTERVSNVLSSIKKLLMRYFIGLLAEVFLVMLLITIGLMIVGLKFQHALIIGLIAGLLNVIPYIGPVIGSLFGLVIGIATNLHLDFYSQILPLIGWMALVFLIVQIIDNIFFQPLIYSSSVNAHPLEIFLVIMIAGGLSGITGMIIAVPSYTVLRVVAKEFFNKFTLVKKLTENI